MKTDKLIGARVVEVSAHKSSEIDWQEVAKLKAELAPQNLTLSHRLYPRKEVTHYGTITLELLDGSRVDIEPNSYYDSYWMEVR